MKRASKTYIQNASAFLHRQILRLTRLIASATRHWRETAGKNSDVPPVIHRSESSAQSTGFRDGSSHRAPGGDFSFIASLLLLNRASNKVGNSGEVITHYDFSPENHRYSRLISFEKSTRGPIGLSALFGFHPVRKGASPPP